MSVEENEPDKQFPLTSSACLGEDAAPQWPRTASKFSERDGRRYGPHVHLAVFSRARLHCLNFFCGFENFLRAGYCSLLVGGEY